MAKQILMIDDERPILEAFQTILEDLGHQVTTCADALEGEQLAIEQHFDLILVDLRMPHRDGAEVVRAVHQKRPGARILIVTGYPDDPIARKALDSGAVGLVRKPFEIGKILDFLGDTQSEGDPRPEEDG